MKTDFLKMNKRFAITVVCGVAFLNGFAEAEASTVLQCDRPVMDFGQVDNGEDVTHTFVLRNDGSRLVKVIQAKPSCSCTIIDLSAKEIAPGETINLTAVLDLAGATGPQCKSIFVRVDDPADTGLLLSMQGEAIEYIQTVPYGLTAFVEPGKLLERKIELTLAEDAPLVIDGIDTGSSSVQTTLVPGKAENQRIIEVCVHLNSHDEPLIGNVEIHTNCPQKPIVKIPYNFTCQIEPIKQPEPLQH